MSVVLAPSAPRVPVIGLRLSLAVVVIASAVLGTILTHVGDPVAAADTAMEPSPSAMF